MPEVKQVERLYSTREVMEILGISRATYWKFVKHYPRQFVTSKIGKERKMRPQALQNWIEFRERLDNA